MQTLKQSFLTYVAEIVKLVVLNNQTKRPFTLALLGILLVHCDFCFGALS